MSVPVLAVRLDESMIGRIEIKPWMPRLDESMIGRIEIKPWMPPRYFPIGQSDFNLLSSRGHECPVAVSYPSFIESWVRSVPIEGTELQPS